MGGKNKKEDDVMSLLLLKNYFSKDVTPKEKKTFGSKCGRLIKVAQGPQYNYSIVSSQLTAIDIELYLVDHISGLFEDNMEMYNFLSALSRAERLDYMVANKHELPLVMLVDLDTDKVVSLPMDKMVVAEEVLGVFTSRQKRKALMTRYLAMMV